MYNELSVKQAGIISLALISVMAILAIINLSNAWMLTETIGVGGAFVMKRSNGK